jgi:hypothetical protein
MRIFPADMVARTRRRRREIKKEGKKRRRLKTRKPDVHAHACLMPHACCESTDWGCQYGDVFEVGANIADSLAMLSYSPETCGP